MTPLQTMLGRLEKVRKVAPDKYVARCPANHDRSPSLSIRETKDGKVLLYCFVGCAAEDVLYATGLSFNDLYPPDEAAYAAATANTGKKFHRQMQRDYQLEQRDEDLMVLRLAQQWMKAGRPLSMEDQARLQLAKSRLGVEVPA